MTTAIRSTATVVEPPVTATQATAIQPATTTSTQSTTSFCVFPFHSDDIGGCSIACPTAEFFDKNPDL